jgi:ribosome-binding protein aMBF1 (putative translation factor)
MTTHEPPSPLGTPASTAAGRRYERSAEYRAQHDRLAPHRAIAGAVIVGRSARGLTQEQLAALLGTTGSAISRIESGRHPVSLDTLAKLGRALGIAFAVGAPPTSGSVVVVPGGVLAVGPR